MRRHRILSVLTVLLLFSLFPAAAFAEKATVTGSEVNVRTGPGMSFAVFTGIPEGTEVEVLNRSDPYWYLVSWDGSNGYVSSEYLALDSSEPTAAITASQESSPGYINAMYVTFRSGPDTSSTVLGTYSSGKTLTITGVSGEWTSVNIDGKDGFVYSQYVSAGSPSAAVVTVEQESGQDDPYGGTPISGAAVRPAPAETSVYAEVKPAEQSPQQEKTASENAASVPETGAGTRASEVTEETASVTLLLPFGSPDASPAEPESGEPALPAASSTTLAPAHAESTADSPSEAGTVSMSLGLSPSSPSVPEEASTVRAESSVSAKDVYINGNNVRFRSSPSMSADIITELHYGSALTLKGIEGDWSRVSWNGQDGYVYSSYLTEGKYEPEQKLSGAQGAELGKEIAKYALGYVGYSYSWGGNSPATGFDCAGFVQYIYSQFGYTTSRVANDVTKDGVHVDPKDIQPGDVLCFYSGNGYVGHVGIYIGDGSFVHAANSATGVVTTSLSTGYYATRGYEIRRII